jgi:hypothetical protein
MKMPFQVFGRSTVMRNWCRFMGPYWFRGTASKLILDDVGERTASKKAPTPKANFKTTEVFITMAFHAAKAAGEHKSRLSERLTKQRSLTLARRPVIFWPRSQCLPRQGIGV